MNNITTYYAARKNPFLWLAALLSLVSAAARIVFACQMGGIGVMAVVVRVILPVAANLFIAFRLPLRGEKQFYVTIGPVTVLTAYMFYAGHEVSPKLTMTLLCFMVCAVFIALYALTFTGKIGSKLVVFVYYLAVIGLVGYDKVLRGFLIRLWPYNKPLFISDAAILACGLCLLLCVSRMPAPKEGDPYRLRWGDRMDGRRVRNMPVMSKLTPYFMSTRCTRSNYIADTIDITNMEKYIRQKRKSGLKHFGITHVILASYARMICEYPAINRFVAGQRVYHHYDLAVNMVVKKEMNKESPDSSIKVKFNPEDTADQVYEKFNTALEKAKEPGISNGFDSITTVFDLIPGLLLAFIGWLLRFLDYFGIMPMALNEVSPFHGSLFITSMGSLGIPPIYHHLYDFGTVPLFIAFGHKYTEYELNKDGETVPHKYLDYKIVTDEGICDGFYYASALKKFRSIMNHPEQLDNPPEIVIPDID